MARLRHSSECALTLDRLKHLLAYDPATGFFTRNASRAREFKGFRAGHELPNGYRQITIDYERHYEHRLAWLYVTGSFAEVEIDHIDCNRLNNRFDNLRLATTSQNQGNKPLQRNNTSGVKGVVWHSKAGKWAARIKSGPKCVHLGLFVSLDDAARAYAEAAKRQFGAFARPT